MDTKASRIPAERVHCFDVDLPEAQEVKKRQLMRIFTSLPGHVVFVPPDLKG